MKITIISVGKIKEKFIQQGISEYKKRLQSYVHYHEVELKDESVPDSISAAEEDALKETEGKRILHSVQKGQYLIALERMGKMRTSTEFAAELDQLATYGQGDICFIIGGSLGLSSEVLHKVNAKLSFSKMTFPHQLMKLILLEQIYRACRINAGHPYHK